MSKCSKNYFQILVQEGFSLVIRTPSDQDSADHAVRSFNEERKIPGLPACVVKGSAAALGSNSYGLADIQNNVSMSRDGMMHLGSISKTFTAAVVMQGWEGAAKPVF